MGALDNLFVQLANLKRLAIPAVLVSTVLIWATVQVSPIVPSSWAHPLWQETATLLGRPISGTISLSPWKTIIEIIKLSTYVCTTWIVFSLSRNTGRAKRFFDVIIAIGAIYALYAVALGLLGTQQYNVFYSPALKPLNLSGPFVLHNSFATFEGLVSLCALTRLIERASTRIIASKGVRRWGFTTVAYIFGAGAPIVIAAIVTVSALVATASRAGVFSTLCALIVMAILVALRLKRSANWRWSIVGAASLLTLLIGLFWISGDTLGTRISDLINAGNADEIRFALWMAAQRMIASSPWLGLGLGTFQDAYPMYATQIFPFIMDKAHSDFLEFAAGIGLPAAVCWWSALLWSAIQMGRGFFGRRKNRIYPLVGLGATILVAVHSSVDFSLQIPAVAMLYAAILGIGLAQSYATEKPVEPI